MHLPHVLYVFVDGPSGGNATGRSFCSYVEGLEDHGAFFKPVYAVQEGTWVHRQFMEKNIPHIALHAKDTRREKQFAKLVKKLMPEICHFWGEAPACAASVKGIKICRLQKPVPPEHLQPYTALSTVTQPTARALGQAMGPDVPVCVLPPVVVPPLDGRPFSGAVRAKYSLEADQQVLLLISQLEGFYGVEAFIQALKGLPENIVLLMAGAGEDVRTLKQALEADGLGHRVRFTGWVDQVAALYAAADGVLMPNGHAHYSMSIVEAWAHKVPVIAAQSPVVRALVEENITGFVYDPAQWQKLVTQVKRVLEHDRLPKKVVDAGFAKYKASHLPADVIAHHEAFYKQLLDRTS